MRLLLLLPNFALLAISGYNLYNGTSLLAETLLHLLVMALCITFISLIVKSYFTVKYVEQADIQSPRDEAYEELVLQRS